IFCSGTLASAPYCRAVDGSNCIRPIEPRDETASHRKLDSAATMPFTRPMGTPCFLDADAINACTSSSLRATRFSPATTHCKARRRRTAEIADRLGRVEWRTSFMPAKLLAETRQARMIALIEYFI